MSSQFSYDLDERQIRILMQDGEAPHNEVMWQKFDQLAKSETKNTIQIIKKYPVLI